MQMAEDRKILEASEEERRAVLAELGWGASRAWSDVASDPEANEAGAELYREMVRRTVDDRKSPNRSRPGASRSAASAR